MGQVIQVNGDYNIKAKEGATITLDTGPSGFTHVTGNLVVDGDTLTVSAENLQVQDNIIVLNYGETGAGVSLTYSGIEVDRGTESHASIIYNENDSSWNIVNGQPGSYNFNESYLRLQKVLTNPETDFGDLTLIGTGTGVVKVTGTLDYENQVTDDDDIPNKRYVDDAIQLNPARQIVQGDSRVITADKDNGGLNYLNELVTESEIAVLVDNVPNSAFYINRAVIQRLEFIGSEITNDDTNSNISLRTNGTGRVQTNYALQLEQLGTTPANTAGYSVLFAKAPSTGDTGLFFVADRSGELISKNRALLYSMLF